MLRKLYFLKTASLFDFFQPVVGIGVVPLAPLAPNFGGTGHKGGQAQWRANGREVPVGTSQLWLCIRRVQWHTSCSSILLSLDWHTCAYFVMMWFLHCLVCVILLDVLLEVRGCSCFVDVSRLA